VDDEGALPDGVLADLNRLGFALVDESSEQDGFHTFFRQGAESDLRLTLERTNAEDWRLAVFSRLRGDFLSKLEHPWIQVDLSRLGDSNGGKSIQVSRTDLADRVPEFLERGLLPMFDAGMAG
jgi:hypothetical protein